MPMQAGASNAPLTILVGGDPEFFVANIATKEFISSKGLVGGTKHYPIELPHGHAQEDNIMLELNIKPAQYAKEFAVNVRDVIRDAVNILSPLGHTIRITGEIQLNEKLKLLPEIYEFGCEPDYNAWTEDMNPKPPLEESDWRFAGGHVHLSVNRQLTFKEQCNIVKWMDRLYGVQCVLADPATRRKAIYGTAGRFRPTQYGDNLSGVEYRVPSNFWCKEPAWTQQAFLALVGAFKLGLEFEFSELSALSPPKLIQAALNDNNRELAKYLSRDIAPLLHRVGD